MGLIINPHTFGNSQQSAIDILTAAGLTTNLQVCLDAGDILSATSSTAQTWVDRSGNAQSFLRGTTSSSQSSDPSFNGVAGALSASEYYSFDGGDRFTLNQANPSWVNDLHQENATGTILAWVWSKAQASGDFHYIVTTVSSFSTDTGFGFFIADNGSVNINIENAGDGVYSAGSTGEAVFVSDDAWTLVGMSLDEAAGDIRWQINANAITESLTAVGASPDTGSADGTLTLGALTGGSLPFANGSRLGQVIIANRAWSAAELALYFNLSRGRYGV